MGKDKRLQIRNQSPRLSSTKNSTRRTAQNATPRPSRCQEAVFALQQQNPCGTRIFGPSASGPRSSSGLPHGALSRAADESDCSDFSSRLSLFLNEALPHSWCKFDTRGGVAKLKIPSPLCLADMALTGAFLATFWKGRSIPKRFNRLRAFGGMDLHQE
jgi:hypothetical protein